MRLRDLVIVSSPYKTHALATDITFGVFDTVTEANDEFDA